MFVLIPFSSSCTKSACSYIFPPLPKETYYPFVFKSTLNTRHILLILVSESARPHAHSHTRSLACMHAQLGHDCFQMAKNMGDEKCMQMLVEKCPDRLVNLCRALTPVHGFISMLPC
jgi:hypothetical protein